MQATTLCRKPDVLKVTGRLEVPERSASGPAGYSSLAERDIVGEQADSLIGT